MELRKGEKVKLADFPFAGSQVQQEKTVILPLYLSNL